MKQIHHFIKSGTPRSLLTLLLIVGIAVLTTGIGVAVHRASAISLTNVSDTLSDSDLSASSAHTIKYTSTNAVGAGETIKVQFDPTGDSFFLNGDITDADIIFDGATLVADVGSCGAGGDEVYLTLDDTAPDKNLTFTVCVGDSVSAGFKRIITATSVIANPAIANSYVIRIAGTQTDSADTRVAVLIDTTVTAAVETSLTFEVQGLGTVTTTDVNGESLTVGVTTTATTIPFGTLQVGVPKTAGQQLKVATNARNGFIVTVQEDQALTSLTGATIDLFDSGASTVNPVAWASPDNTLDQPQTYGHIGLTSEDTTLTAGDEFVTQLFAGNFHIPREVFMHNGPSDGTTANKGLTRVGYKIEIGSLQEAATDYTNHLTYVCTPTF